MYRLDGKEAGWIFKTMKVLRLTSTEATAGRIHPPCLQNPTKVLGVPAQLPEDSSVPSGVFQFVIFSLYGTEVSDDSSSKHDLGVL